jgi:hypothetical protein
MLSTQQQHRNIKTMYEGRLHNMGRLFAEELASGEFATTREQQLAIHFQSNCYPPVPLVMIDTALTAIALMNNDRWNESVKLPEGIQYRNQDTCPAFKIVENFRLDAWIVEEV